MSQLNYCAGHRNPYVPPNNGQFNFYGWAFELHPVLLNGSNPAQNHFSELWHCVGNGKVQGLKFKIQSWDEP
jgi:hypothetical protein